MHLEKLNPDIELLEPENITVISRIPADKKGAQTLDGLYVVSLKTADGSSIDALLKTPYREIITDRNKITDRNNLDPEIKVWSSTMEANALHALQGVPLVPKIYGVLKSGVVGHNISEGAIVEQLALANGPSLVDIIDHTVRGLYLGDRRVVIDLLRSVPLIADYFRGSVERGLVNRDFKKEDLVVRIDSSGKAGILVSDYGMMVHVVSGDKPSDGERYAYGHAIEKMLELNRAMEEAYGHGLNNNEDSKVVAYFKAKGLKTLSDLIESCSNGEFKAPGREGFSKFLDDWESATREQIEAFSQEQPDTRGALGALGKIIGLEKELARSREHAGGLQRRIDAAGEKTSVQPARFGNDSLYGGLSSIEGFISVYSGIINTLRQELMTGEFDPAKIAVLRAISEEYRILVNRVGMNGNNAGSAYPIDVSVVIPVFTGHKSTEESAGYMLESIQSVLQQQFDGTYRIIVVNNSKQKIHVPERILFKFPDSVAVLKDNKSGELAYQNSRGRIVVLTDSLQSSPIEAGIEEALQMGSKYISIFYHTNTMYPSFIRDLHGHLESNPSTDMVHSRHISIDSKGRVISGPNEFDTYYAQQRRFNVGIDTNEPENEGRAVRYDKRARTALQTANSVHNSTAMFRANLLDRVGLANVADLVRGDVYALWKAVSRVGNIDYLNATTTLYRQLG